MSDIDEKESASTREIDDSKVKQTAFGTSLTYTKEEEATLVRKLGEDL